MPFVAHKLLGSRPPPVEHSPEKDPNPRESGPDPCAALQVCILAMTLATLRLIKVYTWARGDNQLQKAVNVQIMEDLQRDCIKMHISKAIIDDYINLGT